MTGRKTAIEEWRGTALANDFVISFAIFEAELEK
jgi:hypothetical protein